MIVCDTGPLVAAALSNDADHAACVRLFNDMHAVGRDLPDIVFYTSMRRPQAQQGRAPGEWRSGHCIAESRVDLASRLAALRPITLAG